MNKKMDILVWLITIIFIGVVFVLPETIPVHWNIYNEVDGYGSKYFALIFALLPIVTYYGMNLDKKLDPKKKSRQNQEIFDLFRNGLTLFFVLMGAYFLYAMFNPNFVKEVSIAFIFGIMFIGIGDHLPRVPQNYTLGIKTPWTLESEYVWNKTHRFGGFMFVVFGLISLLGSFVGGLVSFVLLTVSIIIACIGTLVYSYIIYKKGGDKK